MIASIEHICKVDIKKPKTTYYFTVESMDSRGRSDGAKGPTKAFTTR
jgi:hypothetical protein